MLNTATCFWVQNISKLYPLQKSFSRITLNIYPRPLSIITWNLMDGILSINIKIQLCYSPGLNGCSLYFLHPPTPRTWIINIRSSEIKIYSGSFLLYRPYSEYNTFNSCNFHPGSSINNFIILSFCFPVIPINLYPACLS